MSACTICERHTESTFRVEGLCCHTEARTLEQRLLRLGGVHRLTTDVVGQRLRVAYDAAKTTTAMIAEAVAETGMRAWIDQDRISATSAGAYAARSAGGASAASSSARSSSGASSGASGSPSASTAAGAASAAARAAGAFAASTAFWHAALLIVAAIALGLGLALHALGASQPLVVGLMILAVVSGGVTTLRRALLSIRNRTLDMYVLMLVAVIGASLIGEWFEAATVVVLFAFAQIVERRSLDRARRAIGALIGVTATEVRVRGAHGDTQVPLDQVRVGDLMLVAPGERIALDGLIAGGLSDVNQAPVTGESTPVAKEPGDRLFAGTINGHGALEVQVTAVGDDTTTARIIHLVERAQEQRAPSQAWVDRFAHRYTPIVLILAALVALVPPLLLAQPFAWWIYRALVLLVIACPCALVLSTPISIVSGLAAAARRGVLIKGGVFLEKLASVRALALDKTGTLTRGALTVHEVVASEGHAPDEVIATAAALGARSEHPLARAINAYAVTRGGASIVMPRVHALKALPGQGMSGRIENGAGEAGEAGHVGEAQADEILDENEILIGSPRLFEQQQIPLDGLAASIADVAARGMTLVLVSRGGRAIGAIGLLDDLRAHSREAIDLLRAEGITHVALLTGDHEASARAAGAGGRVDSIEAGLLPADKVAAVRRLRQQHGAIAMVGDGINDAPALAAADIGVAMGVAGTDAAIETADVALMADDLRALAYVIRLGRKTLRTVQTNVAIALGLKLAFMALAVAGLATLWMAVVADMGASLIVVANALRLLRTR
jgi:Cd2+/Zn2+-exporting ATPase